MRFKSFQILKKRFYRESNRLEIPLKIPKYKDLKNFEFIHMYKYSARILENLFKNSNL